MRLLDDTVTLARKEMAVVMIGVFGLAFSLGFGWSQNGASQNVIDTANRNAVATTQGFSALAKGQADLTDRIDRVQTILCSGRHDQRAGCGYKPTVAVVVKPVVESVK